MSNAKQVFHILSYLQYPMLLFVIYFSVEPYLSENLEGEDKLIAILGSINNMLIFAGLALSFSTLQDTTKTSLKFEKTIWESPKKGKLFIFTLTALSILALGFGLFAYFITNNIYIQEVAFGIIVLGIGFLGFVKTAIEVFDNHRKDNLK